MPISFTANAAPGAYFGQFTPWTAQGIRSNSSLNAIDGRPSSCAVTAALVVPLWKTPVPAFWPQLMPLRTRSGPSGQYVAGRKFSTPIFTVSAGDALGEPATQAVLLLQTPYTAPSLAAPAQSPA